MNDYEMAGELEWYRAALETIAGPADPNDPLMAIYREAGGGYEGLQAIARYVLSGPVTNWDTPTETGDEG